MTARVAAIGSLDFEDEAVVELDSCEEGAPSLPASESCQVSAEDRGEEGPEGGLENIKLGARGSRDSVGIADDTVPPVLS